MLESRQTSTSPILPYLTLLIHHHRLISPTVPTIPSYNRRSYLHFLALSANLSFVLEPQSEYIPELLWLVFDWRMHAPDKE